jgi:hypothetical protein
MFGGRCRLMTYIKGKIDALLKKNKFTESFGNINFDIRSDLKETRRDAV